VVTPDPASAARIERQAVAGCRDCGEPVTTWDPGDPLYDPAGGQCPRCSRHEIDLDKAYERRAA
jgi:hypothetical protein